MIARFDVDRLIDYRSKRPTMTFVTDHWESYQAPELVVHLLRDADGTPFLLLRVPNRTTSGSGSPLPCAAE